MLVIAFRELLAFQIFQTFPIPNLLNGLWSPLHAMMHLNPPLLPQVQSTLWQQSVRSLLHDGSIAKFSQSWAFKSAQKKYNNSKGENYEFLTLNELFFIEVADLPASSKAESSKAAARLRRDLNESTFSSKLAAAARPRRLKESTASSNSTSWAKFVDFLLARILFIVDLNWLPKMEPLAIMRQKIK